MVNVGIIGLGPEWESRFGPALRKLRERIAIRAIYDPVASRAAQVAEDWRADVVDSLRALTERADIRGYLLLDAGWAGWETVRLTLASRKPLFVVSGFRNDPIELRSLHETALSVGQTVMPAFGLRYTPATCRLRELLATSLGPAQSIAVTISSAVTQAEPASNGSERNQLIAAADWCRYVIGTAPTRVAASAESVRLEFASNTHGDTVVHADLSFAADSSNEAGNCSITTDISTAAGFQAVVHSIHGEASLHSATEIDWIQNGERNSESLETERSATDVMFDLFCRRVVGGLIPVADVADVVRGARLADAVWSSSELGQPVEIETICPS